MPSSAEATTSMLLPRTNFGLPAAFKTLPFKNLTWDADAPTDESTWIGCVKDLLFPCVSAAANLSV